MTGDDRWPRIVARGRTRVSPWVDIVERTVVFAPDAEPQVYHAVAQADYIAIVARTPDGRIPLVRQYRPAIEAFAWELPAGLVDPGEDATEGCRRELMEECGLRALAVHPLGVASPCTGRFDNRIHSFFVEAGEQAAGFVGEPGVTMRLVTPAELVATIRSGDFIPQLHLGALLLAELRGLLALPR